MPFRVLTIALAVTGFSLLGHNHCAAQASWSLKDDATFQPRPVEQLPAPLEQPASKDNAVTPEKSSRATSGQPSKRLNLDPPQLRPSAASDSPLNAPPRNRPATSTAFAKTPAQDGGDYIDLDTCFVSFIDDVDLPAEENGVLREVNVKEGESFKKGKIVAQIDDQMFRLQLDKARAELDKAQKLASDGTSIKAARYKVKLATVEADKARSLMQKGSKSESEYRRAIYSQRIADLELTAAENEQEMAMRDSLEKEIEVREVKERIRRHAIPTTFDGYVIEKFRDAGEWVNMGEKVLRVARMDRLYVQGNISSDQLNPFEVANKKVTVTLELARGEKATFEGNIVSVGLEKQGSNLYMVKAEVSNRPEQGYWVLQPGSQVQMRIHLSDNATAGDAGRLK